MGRRQSSQLKTWNVTHEATDDAPCTICGESWSTKSTRITVEESKNPKWAHLRLKLSAMQIITLPEGVVERSAIRRNTERPLFVTPLLRDDTLTDTVEAASLFPLPFPPNRMIYGGWVSEMHVCAPCYYRMRRNLESNGILDSGRLSWVQARVVRRGQLINDGSVPASNRRGYVERRSGPMERRVVERRRTEVNGPRTIKSSYVKEEK